MTRQKMRIFPKTNWIIDYDEKYKKQIARFEEQHPNWYKKMYDFLTFTPDVSVGGRRVFPLMGDGYRGAWEYKPFVSRGTFRVYYILDNINRKVRIYYAGSKPNKVPLPSLILSELSTQNNHYSGRKT